MIDVEHQISAVQRAVGSRVLEAGEARVVTITRTYDAAVEDVWDAVTDASRIPRWFLPVSGDLRVGGRYQLEGNAGGVIERCEPPTSFAATWEFGGDISWIELRLTPEPDGRTRFRLEHIAHVDDERWTEFGPGAVGIGWDLSLVGLGLHLDGAEQVDAAAFMAWAASDDGSRFTTLCGRSWGAADAASGTDPTVADARAERTIAFYTGG
jgi:uncharacterized protein YndB with AHSA1/START domain